MKYRVLHSLSSMEAGGAQAFIMNVYRNIDKDKYHFDFLLNREDGIYNDEIKKLGGSIYLVPTRREGVFKERKALDRFFKLHAKDYDAVHIHRSSLTSIEVLYYAKKYGVKNRIYHCHSTSQVGWMHHVIHWLRKPFIHSWANKYLACSNVAADWAFCWTGVRHKVLELKNGIDTALYKFNEKYRSDVREELGVPNDALVVGHVGRFLEVKNHTFIIDIFKEILVKQADSYLLLAGTGVLQDAIMQKVSELGITERVKFLGNRNDIYRLLSAMDFLLFPSLYEGLPFVPVEAQAAGVRVLCSDRVSPEVKLSDGLKFLSIEKPAKEWADMLFRFEAVDKEQMRQSVISGGYDIKVTIENITNKIYE